uniref:ATP synthase F0 subunit 8 n=1 Tax=Ascaris lumbricoides TaxID=6252 RepID=A0A0M3HFT8_ASCLU
MIIEYFMCCNLLIFLIVSLSLWRLFSYLHFSCNMSSLFDKNDVLSVLIHWNYLY